MALMDLALSEVQIAARVADARAFDQEPQALGDRFRLTQCLHRRSKLSSYTIARRNPHPRVAALEVVICQFHRLLERVNRFLRAPDLTQQLATQGGERIPLASRARELQSALGEAQRRVVAKPVRLIRRGIQI